MDPINAAIERGRTALDARMHALAVRDADEAREVADAVFGEF